MASGSKIKKTGKAGAKKTKAKKRNPMARLQKLVTGRTPDVPF